jgi:hypothetical protein
MTHGIKLIIDGYQEYPTTKPSHLCTKATPKTIYVSFHKAKIELLLDFEPPSITLRLMYQSIVKLPEVNIIYEGVTWHRLATHLYNLRLTTFHDSSNGIYFRVQPALQYLMIGKTAIIVINIRTFMMWRVVCKFYAM